MTATELRRNGAEEIDMTGYEMIAGLIEDTADWRERKSEEFPSDERNLAARNELLRLATDANGRGDSDTARRFAALDGPDNNASEVISEILRQVGFARSFENVDSLLEAILSDVTVYNLEGDEAA